MSARVFVAIGLISYSLYLWHWPLIVFAKYISFEPLSAASTASLLALSVVLAAFSWRYIEMPVRRRAVLQTRSRLLRAAAYSTVVIIGSGAVCAANAGLPWRVPAQVALL